MRQSIKVVTKERREGNLRTITTGVITKAPLSYSVKPGDGCLVTGGKVIYLSTSYGGVYQNDLEDAIKDGVEARPLEPGESITIAGK